MGIDYELSILADERKLWNHIEYSMNDDELFDILKPHIEKKIDVYGKRILKICKNIHVFNSILEMGVDPLKNSDGIDLLLIHINNVEIFQKLLEMGVDPLDDEEEVLELCNNGIVFQKLFDMGINPTKYNGGRNFLFNDRNITIFNMLIDMGCDYMGNDSGYNLLLYYIKNNEIVKRLLELGCDPKYRFSGRDLIKRCEDADTLKLLLDNGCDSHLLGRMLITKFAHTSMLELLIRMGCNIYDNLYVCIYNILSSNNIYNFRYLIHYDSRRLNKIPKLCLNNASELLSNCDNNELFQILLGFGYVYKDKDIDTIEKAIMVDFPMLKYLFKRNMDDIIHIVKNIHKRSDFDQKILLSNKIIRKEYKKIYG